MCPMEPDILITDAIRYNHNARYSFMTIDDFIDMGLRSSDEKKYYIENLCVAFSLLSDELGQFTWMQKTWKPGNIFSENNMKN